MGHTGENIELGRKPHDEQQQEGERRSLVRLAPGGRRHHQQTHEHRHFMIDQGAGRQPEAPPAARIGRAGIAVRSSDKAHQERQFVPAPQHQRTGEGDIGRPGAGLLGRGNDAAHGKARRDRSQRDTYRPGVAGQLIQPQHEAGGHEPQHGRKKQRQCKLGHDPPALTRPAPCARWG